MEYKLKHPYQLNPVTCVEIEDEVVRVRWSNDNKLFSRNTFVTIRVKGDKKSIYRILKGASTEEIISSEVLVSYSTFKQLKAKEGAIVEIDKSSCWERNVLFYFNNPDPRKRHQVIRDFVVTFTGFVVSIIEMLQLFGIKP